MANRGFENFDFANNSEWTRYCESLSPAPTPQKLHQVKQNWYKQHIDPNYNPSASSRSVNPPSSVSSLQKLQALLFVLSLPGLFMGKGPHLIILGHLVGLLHYHSFPKLNLSYWRPVLGDDNLHSIAFLLLFFLIPASSLWVIPAYLGTFVYLPGVIGNLSFPNKIKEVAQKLDRKKMAILQTRSDCEAWVGIAVTLTSIIGYSHWITPIIYWQYARMRFMLNYFSKVTYSNIRIKSDAMLAGKPGIGRVWEKIKGFCSWLCTIEPNQSNNSSCQVF